MRRIIVFVLLLLVSLTANAAVTIRISAAGDCTPGGNVHDSGYESYQKLFDEHGAEWFLENVRSVFSEDDLTIVNFESTIPEASDKCKNEGFNFKSLPSCTEIFTSSSVEVCTVANNHTADFGQSGLNSTVEALSAAGLSVCGYDRIVTTEVKGVRVTICGFTWWQKRADCLDTIKNLRPECDLLIVTMHWGNEKQYETADLQKWWGHAIIDAGADVILGSHTHLPGGIEKYNDKYIVYSLGNFSFGGNKYPADYDSYIFVEEFTFDDRVLSDTAIDIIPCSISSDKEFNNCQPVVLEGFDARRVLGKIHESTGWNWESFNWIK